MICRLVLLSWALTLSFCIGIAHAESLNETVPAMTRQEFGGLTQEQLAQFFKGYKSSFVLLDTKTGHYLRYNPQLCDMQLSPCSTFKIFNSLVGLETGVLKNENHPFTWDGTKYDITSWNRDHTLQSAVTNSVVWYFQHVASLVGEERMKKFIEEAHYGNQDISGGITKFWLGSTLKISANEQVMLLKGLVDDELPFSKRSMAIVRGLIRLKETDTGTLYGKTGSDMVKGKWILGWFVGYVVKPGRTFVFATNIQAADGAWGKKARELTEKLLTESGLL
jgi:bla regulator protein BlaR1